MAITEAVFSAIFNILSIYIGFRVIKLFLHKKEVNSVYAMIIYSSVWIFNWSVYYIFSQVLLTIASLVLGMLIATFLLYEGNVIKKIVAVVSAVALGMVCENAIWILFGQAEVLQMNAAIGSLFSSSLNVILVLALEKCFKFDKKDYVSPKSYINIIMIVAGSIVLGEILVIQSADNQGMAMVGLSVICLIDVSTYYIYDKINEVYIQKLERKSMEQRVAMYENQLELMEESQRKIQLLRHDMKNHLLLIQSYIDKQEYESAQRYLMDVTDYMKVKEAHVQTNNSEVDAILNYKIEQAETMGCEVETKIQIPDVCFIPKLDLNILLGNLLDNAIEALSRVDERYLYIGLKYQKGVFTVRIYNTFDGKLVRQGEHFLTRKQDHTIHGLGLQHVKDVVKKYDGELVTEVEEGLFKVSILIFTEVVHS